MDIVWFILAGVAAGIIGGMGMGGGTVLIPLLILALATEQLPAQGANLVAFLPMAAVSLAINAKHGLVKTKGLLWLIVPAVVASAASAFFTDRIDVEVLKIVFGSFLTGTGVTFFIVSLKKAVTKKHKSARDNAE